ncbi:hypothetical protein [Arcicella rigui]|uniref:ATP synthase F0 subunit 8 n=1 Tax=Arcicella rigui TaxID=797020 RepID=A0ABU5Q6K9_9BACT|nr:hypothetical protein [Arcicella rigui]MEA5138465.1 hypothetical protein [Arcicella rigui]
MKKSILYLLIAFAICVCSRIIIGLYFHNQEVDKRLNQFSWAAVFLFLLGMISIRVYYTFNKNKF